MCDTSDIALQSDDQMSKQVCSLDAIRNIQMTKVQKQVHQL